MTVPFAINGLGRVGRALVRITRERPDLRLVAINDQSTPEILARLLAHDTLHGRYPGTVAAEGDSLVLDGRRIPVGSAPSPDAARWEELAARGEDGEPPWIVVESTGRFRSRGDAAGHLGGSVEKVVVSATAGDVDATLIMGVNHERYEPGRHHVVSNASCTANCLAAMVRVLDEAFGIEHGLMNTVHCYTNSQRLMDMSHPDPRRARAAALNIIPTTSDAVEALGEVLPHLAGRVRGLAYRVPVPNGSLVDLTALLGRGAASLGGGTKGPDREEVIAAFRRAEAGELAGILATTDEELVSADFVGNPHSAIVDLPLVAEAGNRLYRVVAWYDNEWGYANRLSELLAWMGGSRGGIKP